MTLETRHLPLPDRADDPGWLDYQRLLDLFNHELLDGPGWDSSPESALELSRRSVREWRQARFLAYLDDEAVGFGVLRINIRDDPEAGNLMVYVAPDHRGAGIGRLQFVVVIRGGRGHTSQ